METKSFKTVQVKFLRKFNFNNYPQKSQIYHWVHKFKATGPANNFSKKAENFKSGRRLTVRYLDNVQAEHRIKLKKKKMKRRISTSIMPRN